MPAAVIPVIVKYGVPVVAYCIGHLVGWLTHKKKISSASTQIAKKGLSV